MQHQEKAETGQSACETQLLTVIHGSHTSVKDACHGFLFHLAHYWQQIYQRWLVYFGVLPSLWKVNWKYQNFWRQAAYGALLNSGARQKGGERQYVFSDDPSAKTCTRKQTFMRSWDFFQWETNYDNYNNSLSGNIFFFFI